MLKGLGNPPIYEETLKNIVIVSRIRRTLTVQERAAAFENTAEAAAEERRRGSRRANASSKETG